MKKDTAKERCQVVDIRPDGGTNGLYNVCLSNDTCKWTVNDKDKFKIGDIVDIMEPARPGPLYLKFVEHAEFKGTYRVYVTTRYDVDAGTQEEALDKILLGTEHGETTHVEFHGGPGYGPCVGCGKPVKSGVPDRMKNYVKIPFCDACYMKFENALKEGTETRLLTNYVRDLNEERKKREADQ